jgi:hypothetical protein
MSDHMHDTVSTEFIEAGGIRFAYRRFGGGSCAPLGALTRIPLVFSCYLKGR